MPRRRPARWSSAVVDSGASKVPPTADISNKKENNDAMKSSVDHDEGVDVRCPVVVKNETGVVEKMEVEKINVEKKLGEAPIKLPPVLTLSPETDPKFLSYLQIWLVLAFNYIYNYLKRLSDSIQLQAELNRTKAKQVARSMELIEASDHDCSFSSGRESGYYSVEQHSPCKEYASSESPQISPRLPDDIKVYNDNRSPIVSPAFTLSLAKPLGPAGNAKNAQIDLSIPDFESSAKYLIRRVNQTKYVTAIFEAQNGGIDILIEDVLSELQLWFEEHGLLGIACEVHWSVPEKRRNRLVETRMKEGIHQALRKNNRKVMDLKNDKSRSLPLTLAESSTQENSFRQTALDCFQGVYRRFYDTLLPYQHKETVEWHEPFWSLKNKGLPDPNPEQFLLGTHPNKLVNTSIVAVNLIALQVTKRF